MSENNTEEKKSEENNTENKGTKPTAKKSAVDRIKALYAAHPGLIKVLLFSVVLLLLLLMVYIQTDDGAAHSTSGVLGDSADSSMADGSGTGNAASESETKDKSGDRDADKEDNKDDNKDQNTAPALNLEAFDIIGEDFSSLEDTLGKGIAEGKPNTRYFMSAGADISYDHETETITGIELDGEGDGRAEISIAGVILGDSLEDAKKTLNEKGIDIIDLQENSFMCDFYLGGDEATVYEIYAEADEEGIITCMSLNIT